MGQASPQPIRLADYTPPAFIIDRTELDFDLHDEATTVKARLTVRRNPAAAAASEPGMRLDGEQLTLVSVSLDGRTLPANEFEVDEHSLTLPCVPNQFVLETEVSIDPKNNTSLEGLYLSSGNYCTQCEAEGFRKITYYLDRPDALSQFTTTIHADAKRFPVMLSNGNLVDEGSDVDGRRWVKWDDPFAKPSYLFALVAGQLSCIADEFETRSGRKVALEIFVEPHNADKCGHAMASLKRSMAWDEEVYGLEYDLDIFMIVAVDDFNMGAMENKGLNVFNSKYVLAKPETATDADFTAIEAVIAHEYFHNWTGNRVTCRDWFQLSLKEGLTVFRDQEFSADMASRAVKRIQDVRILRSHQFPEDAGPMAHPIRPDSYIEINNFYTVTIYNKGAEVIRMMHTLLGQAGFRKGMDLYFERHDGQAVTTEDFVKAMEDANEFDLSQFRRWYSQAGTPQVKVSEQFDAQNGDYLLDLEQSCAPTPGQETKEDFHIPLKLSLLDRNGGTIPFQAVAHDSGAASSESSFSTGSGASEMVVNLREAHTKLRFSGLTQAPVASIGRGFSAPVGLQTERSDDELAFLMGHDTDAFNRWDAAQEYAYKVLLELLTKFQQSGELGAVPANFVRAFEQTLRDDDLDPALIAEALRLPSESNLADRLSAVDPEQVSAVRGHLRRQLAVELQAPLMSRYASLQTNAPYEFTGQACAQRSLKNLCLGYLMELNDDTVRRLCLDQLAQADNMTDSLGALACIANDDHQSRLETMAQFRERWSHEPLVLDKWFSLRAMSALEGTLSEVTALMHDPAFDLKNPNRIRSLIGAFCAGNPLHFHAADGSGYDFLRAQTLILDSQNPQVTARLLGAFSQWKRYEPGRRELMRETLEGIASAPGLSRDAYEVVSKTLGR